MKTLSHALLLLLPLIPFSFALVRGSADSGSGVSFDLQAYIDREVKAGKKLIEINPGRYRVTPRNRAHLRLQNLDNLSIDATGVEMVCTETTRALTIENCRALTLIGLTIDYDPLPFTQGRIVNMSPDGLIHDIELFEGYPTSGEITGTKYEIFRSDTRTLRFGSYYGCTVTSPEPGRLRVVKPDNYRNQHPEQVGDIIATACANAPGGSIPHAVHIKNSNQVKLEAVRLYASNCFGFFETHCKENVYRQCIVQRRPAMTDIKPRADPRIRSLNADAYHSKYAEVGPSYIECEAQFQGDDCVAINGDYHMIMATLGNELRVLAKKELNIVEGDSVELISYEGLRLPDAIVVSVTPDGNINNSEKAFLKSQRMNDNLKNNRQGSLTKAFRILVDRNITLPMGSLICSAHRIGNGFIVMDCTFGFNRSRGILVKASQGIIQGNQLEGCWGSAIKLAPEYWWLEAGSSMDVVINDNDIRNCLERAIVVSSQGGQGQVSPAGAHTNITINGNRIVNSPIPQIRVTSTDQLNIENNTILDSRQLRLDHAIELENCTNATVSRSNRTMIVEGGGIDRELDR
ncbi:right-handed parallel beta-helix repeat-containing protein [Planctomycetota bacterium]